ncbi:PHD finger protein 7 isoform X2 [Manis pentadactyla]|uniref:PHD finger protein 7 isoform X2 n=1 Tax=Manis pentadactyla TaxID=143292 RepID=UPI001874B9FC|nr:PHD finger protein 7 isoform X2 [Manis pentadactyla]
MKTVKDQKECQVLRKSAKTRRATRRKLSSGPVCLLCLREPGDPEKLGEFLQKDNLSVHYFCLILSSKLLQRGRSNRGFYGFLPEDIREEAARASRKEKGAAINCQEGQCARNFHLPCGQERGCLSQFYGEYKSFCGKHRPTQDIQRGQVGEQSCVLCCEDLSQASVENIQSPCCSRPVYHRECIQKYAHTSAKHFFKCPQCNNREEFPQEMLRMGIHIPDRDAAWELEPGAFSELYQHYQHCDAPVCLYEQGRDSFEDEGRWCLTLCATCGSRGTHRHCSSLRSCSKTWECEDCAPSAEAADCTAENSGDTPCCSSTFSSGHFCTGTSPDEHLGPCTDRPGPSLLEKPESSSGRRGRSGQPKGARMTKSYKKSK